MKDNNKLQVILAEQGIEDELTVELARLMYKLVEAHEGTIGTDVGHRALVAGHVTGFLNLICTEKLKLLAEVRERVVGEKTSPNFDNEYGYCDNCEFQPTDGTKHCLCYYDEKLRKKQRAALTKLEAEL